MRLPGRTDELRCVLINMNKPRFSKTDHYIVQCGRISESTCNRRNRIAGERV
jgi:hypothetical protein